MDGDKPYSYHISSERNANIRILKRNETSHLNTNSNEDINVNINTNSNEDIHDNINLNSNINPN